MTIPHTPILTAAEMREADRLAVEKHRIPSAVLMENAARNAWLALRPRIDGHRERILVLCGGGNNGGDGLALARHGLIDGYDITVWLSSSRLSPDAQLQLDILRSFAPERIVTDLEALEQTHWNVLVDALLGTGASGELREPVLSATRWMNGAAPRLRCALDIPTGLSTDTGSAGLDAVECDLTVTMAALKPGLLLGRGPDLSGEIVVVPIGAPPALYRNSPLGLLDAATARALLPPVTRTRHKYDRGLVAVIGGAPGMRGAGVLAASAARDCGAGVVRLVAPHATHHALPWPPVPAEIMLGTAEEGLKELLERSAAVVLGPGLGRNDEAENLVRTVLAGTTAPVVLDADGLFGFAGNPKKLRERPGECELVVTPHYGEAARLLGAAHAAIAASPVEYARELARRTNALCVLKGAPSVVALPDGRSWITSAGNPGMATGGSGDVLAGMIGACIAQRHDATSGTLLGVHLHGGAGDRAARRYGVNGVTAGRIVEAVAAARRALEETP